MNSIKKIAYITMLFAATYFAGCTNNDNNTQPQPEKEVVTTDTTKVSEDKETIEDEIKQYSRTIKVPINGQTYTYTEFFESDLLISTELQKTKGDTIETYTDVNLDSIIGNHPDDKYTKSKGRGEGTGLDIRATNNSYYKWDFDNTLRIEYPDLTKESAEINEAVKSKLEQENKQYQKAQEAIVDYFNQEIKNAVTRAKKTYNQKIDEKDGFKVEAEIDSLNKLTMYDADSSGVLGDNPEDYVELGYVRSEASDYTRMTNENFMSGWGGGDYSIRKGGHLSNKIISKVQEAMKTTFTDIFKNYKKQYQKQVIENIKKE
ncbi:MAG: hypothetical protein KJ583_03945 [Nanoarchaeota archaeon]|nr:hypothetical protein [Nanoarchaeota archaeon]MBU1270150.1 hypothetical protein [Nanoarchaeota archaeon]MBU1604444.1 hypothetical protein [Nanoarchaeota archaeon]